MLDTTSLLLTHLRSQPKDTTYYIKEKPYSVGYLIGEIEHESMFGIEALNTLIGEVINGLTERKCRPYQPEHLQLSQMMASSNSALSIIQVLSIQTNRVISGISDRSLVDSEGYNKVLRHPAIKPLVKQLNSLINP